MTEDVVSTTGDALVTDAPSTQEITDFREAFAYDCRRCADESGKTGPMGISITKMRMFCCVVCGNKRCPHATDHRLACTGSNKTGQNGSYYENWGWPAVTKVDPTEAGSSGDAP